MPYQPEHLPETLTVNIRSLDYRVYRWGNADARPVFLLHGFADTAMSFQFLADVMAPDWCLLAPDLQGFGDSSWNSRGYWFPDYLADLDALVEHFAPGSPLRLVGHSMGGNIINHYAGIFPHRVSHAISLDSFGMPDTRPEQVPAHLARWLQQWRARPVYSEYDDISSYVEIIQQLAPHLHAERARFLADYWCKPNSQGRVISKIDPNHKMVNPILYRREEARACWRQITAAPMLVLGRESYAWERYYNEGMRDDYYQCFDGLREEVIEQSGHMLHLDQPEQLGRLLDEFIKQE